ncbi:DUF58 domain-containing protein [Paenibacillus athensensis]|uniref:DUF58 domain-containing protein n=1 Tax=Paenibacillus athensensis TaxID=1967502 RepID=A0A4Y8PWP0_9BACL|nr:DUF58 domain-containing protein [Paenibacillus athensensis]MCD1261451.1 DUF58 domain-containing protein [Paenibacillus athensensis]
MGISWILLIAAALFFAQHRLYRKLGFRGLRVTREFDRQRLHAGEELTMIETIVNRKPLPLPWLRLEAMLPAGLLFQQQTNLDVSAGDLFQNHKSLFSLMPYTKMIRRHRVRCMKRGWYRLETVAVSIGDVLGLQAASAQQKHQAELLVYPQLARRDELPLPSSSWQGDITVKRWIVPDPFLKSGVREYRYGDTMNSIHWKATARSQRLQVHSRDYTADPRLLLLLNTQITETMWEAVSEPELVEQGLRYAATLAHDAVSQGVPVGFGSNSYTPEAPHSPLYAAPEGGWPQLEYLMELMAKMEVACCRTFADYLQQYVNTDDTALDIVLITAFISDKIEAQAERLRAAGHAVFVVDLRSALAADAGKEAEADASPSAVR